MTIRGARSLDVLLGQLNAFAPKRSKASDGGRASTAHTVQNPESDHEPRQRAGEDRVWTARDFTNDPAGGLDCERLAAALVAGNDPRIKYLIWNHNWWRPGVGWRKYTGPNPHDHHLHLSARDEARLFDNTDPWALPGLTTEEDDMFTDTDRQLLQDVREQLLGSRKPGEGPGLPEFVDDSTGRPLTLVQALGQVHRTVTRSWGPKVGGRNLVNTIIEMTGGKLRS